MSAAVSFDQVIKSFGPVQVLHRAERLDDVVELDGHRGAHAATLPRERNVSCSASTPAPISPAWSPSGV